MIGSRHQAADPLAALDSAAGDLLAYDTVNIADLPTTASAPLYPVLTATLVQAYGTNAEGYPTNATVPLQIEVPQLASGKYSWR